MIVRHYYRTRNWFIAIIMLLFIVIGGLVNKEVFHLKDSYQNNFLNSSTVAPLDEKRNNLYI